MDSRDEMGLDDIETPQQSRNALAGDTPRSRVDYYRSVCQLPAVLDPATGRIGFTAGMVWAVAIPSEVGQMVKADLDARKQGGGPIVTHPHSHTWTFLVRSDIPATMIAAESAWLRTCRIAILGNGDRVALPSPTDQGSDYRGWITAAHSVFRPSGRAVLHSVHSFLTPARRRAL
ncbi:hypothetical protein SAMN04244553_5735 [Nocardia amikacinitolerans]|uniref:DNA-directed RNA polymerase subunit beta n=1 Tax=Nocardia amikacinitolerans TaxID=756689 RepID=A0A285LV23_9NOCA|nr:DNA-directed RNA polymerase subunit beta [Nocardia amikacinitolerans]SNY88750.1 hypothetical protein SAMN04244553_5735 [Nocardia amikacinitolerans]